MPLMRTSRRDQDMPAGYARRAVGHQASSSRWFAVNWWFFIVSQGVCQRVFSTDSKFVHAACGCTTGSEPRAKRNLQTKPNWPRPSAGRPGPACRVCRVEARRKAAPSQLRWRSPLAGGKCCSAVAWCASEPHAPTHPHSVTHPAAWTGLSASSAVWAAAKATTSRSRASSSPCRRAACPVCISRADVRVAITNHRAQAAETSTEVHRSMQPSRPPYSRPSRCLRGASCSARTV
jgi:hypothetical protein